MIDLDKRSDEWVTDWVNKHVKTRVLDGRPDRVFIAQLKKDVAQLLHDYTSELSAPASKPKAKKVADNG